MSADSISSLPDSIMDSILARLSLREAVRTSILSTGWRYKWTSIPELVIDFRVDGIFLDTSKIKDAIGHVLRQHQGLINRFSLDSIDKPNIDQLINLSSAHVHDFTLRIFWADNKHEIVSPFFSFQNLMHLYLQKCIFKPPPEFKGFSKLTTLDFQEVDYDPAIFTQFISQSPLLERVRIQRCTPFPFFFFQNLKHLYLHKCMFKLPPEFKGFSKLTTLDFEEVDYDPAIFRHFISQSPLLERIRIESCTELDIFEIEGPKNLRVFEFHGLLKTICFKKSLLLAEVSLSIPSAKSFTGFKFQIPPMLEILHLHPCRLEEFSGAGDVPNHFADSLDSLKALHITISMGSIKEVACAFCIARSSPNLEMLVISFDEDYRIEEAVREFTLAQETPDPYLRQLKRVKLFFLYSDPVYELLRYLLISAVRLEELVISSPPISDDELNQLMLFPRASPTALVFADGEVL